MGRPIIGITGELDAARWGDWLREAVISPVSYIRAVDRSGGAPVVLAPVLYVLSIGPVAFVIERTGKGKESALTLYAPRLWLAENKPLRKPLEWYIDLWTPG